MNLFNDLQIVAAGNTRYHSTVKVKLATVIKGNLNTVFTMAENTEV